MSNLPSVYRHSKRLSPAHTNNYCDLSFVHCWCAMWDGFALKSHNFMLSFLLLFFCPCKGRWFPWFGSVVFQLWNYWQWTADLFKLLKMMRCGRQIEGSKYFFLTGRYQRTPSLSTRVPSLIPWLVNKTLRGSFTWSATHNELKTLFCSTVSAERCWLSSWPVLIFM